MRGIVLSTALGAALTFGVAHSPATAVPLADGIVTEAPFATALRAELKSLGFSGTEIGTYYRDRSYAPVWFGEAPRARQLIMAMNKAHEHGLPREQYGTLALADLAIRVSDDATRAQAEIALSVAFVRFARHLNSGILIPREVDKEIFVEPEVKTAGHLLDAAVASPSIGALVDDLAPSHPDYARLLEEKTRLEAKMESGGFGAPIPSNRLLYPGYDGERVVLVRQRLRALGYDVEGNDPFYDDALESVVKAFQADNKLTRDGLIGPATFRNLNDASPAGRLEQILVNLERHRWLNVERGARHIVVNIPDFTMAVVDNGAVSFRSDVVVGKNTWDRRTPEFNDRMSHMVINPYWHVPKSIARREYLPMLQRDSSALRRRGLIVTNDRGQVIRTAGRDWSGYSSSYFPFYIKQPPGSANALGRVKFMFPNKHNIYLHDTPAKKLFGHDRRAYSHGCIRVARPFELAYHLLQPQSQDPEGQFQAMLKTGKERYHDLETDVPIFLTYHTAFVAEDGTIVYRDDVYDRDDIVLEALRGAGVTLDGAQG